MLVEPWDATEVASFLALVEMAAAERTGVINRFAGFAVRGDACQFRVLESAGRPTPRHAVPRGANEPLRASEAARLEDASILTGLRPVREGRDGWAGEERRGARKSSKSGDGSSRTR